MGKTLKYILCFIIVDLFFFSTTFRGMRGINSKEIMAVIGIFLYVTDLRRRGNLGLSKEFIGLVIYSLLISLAAIFSSVYHNTRETVYTTYFMSMLTWLGGAYTAVRAVKAIHGKITLELLSTYIVAVSVTQGILSVVADIYTPLGDFFCRVVPGLDYSRSSGRLFGFGSMTTLDTAGIRYGLAALICCNCIVSAIKEDDTTNIPWYILAFLVITVTGNMVARTTSVGCLVGLAYLLLYLIPFNTGVNQAVLRTWLWIIVLTAGFFLLMTVLYNSDSNFHDRTRFAFEGFFSLIETGHWETGSNNVLKDMYIWPDNAQTWIFGDGYFNNPRNDPNYLGEVTHGYYMHTDVGYLRFIYFFGLIGLTIFSLFIIYAGRTCARLTPGYSLFFLALTSMHFLVWLKVATDCFFILGLFVCLGYVKNLMEKTEEDTLEIEE